jgi:hypothetical protein
MLVVLSIEGVLSKSPDLRTEPPSIVGKVLFESLKDRHRVLLLSVGNDVELVRSWLLKERFKNYASVQCMPKNTALSVPAWKASVVREMLSEGWDIAMFIDSDPKAVQSVFLEGVPSLLVASPQYARPEWRPDSERHIKPWDDLVSIIEKESLAKDE